MEEILAHIGIGILRFIGFMFEISSQAIDPFMFSSKRQSKAKK